MMGRVARSLLQVGNPMGCCCSALEDQRCRRREGASSVQINGSERIGGRERLMAVLAY